MPDPNLPQTLSNRLTSQELAGFQLPEELPFLTVTLLERRYLTDFQSQRWRFEVGADDLARPLLREVTALGRPPHPGDWAQAMPHVLNACYEPGHAVVMAVHGDGCRHRLYLGARRLIGRGAGSTEDYLAAQESAFRAHFTGLEMSAPQSLDGDELQGLAALLQTGPALAVLTGIPSGRNNGRPDEWQSLDHLIKAVGNCPYALLVVAEPVEAWEIDHTLDACRRLKSEIHAYVRRTISLAQGQSESESVTRTVPDRSGGIPPSLQAAILFLSALPNFGQPALAALDIVSLLTVGQRLGAQSSHGHQVSTATNWQNSSGYELWDANAEACEFLLQNYMDRLALGKSSGWWRTAIYVVAENDAARQRVIGAVRSLSSGPTTPLDPLRTIELPAYQLRPAIEYGQIFNLRPAIGQQSHPLGSLFDPLGTCLNSEELAVVINLPQREIPGLPMRDHSEFALSTPPEEDEAGAIELGILLDSLGRDLVPVKLTSAELNRHCFVTGATGYGKTNTCMQILLEAHRKLNTPFLVIEPAKAEYRRLTQAAGLTGKLRVYSVGGDSPLPFRLNPFSLMPGVPLGRHIDLLKAVFNASFPMFAGMSYVLEEAILDIYTERGWSLYTSQNSFLSERAPLDERSALTPCLADLHNQIDRVLERKKYGQEVHQNMGAALRSRLKSLMVGNKGTALNTRRGLPLEDLFKDPTIIELKNLGDDEEKAFVMALLFIFLYEYAEIRQHELLPADREKLQHLTLIEEAHRLLKAAPGHINPETGDPAAKAVTMFTDMLAEMRAYGEGFIIADQIPTKLTPETLKNSNLKIVHRLIAPDDRQIVGGSINLSEPQTRHLNNLKPGLAVVHTERLGEAILTRVYPAKEQYPLEHFDQAVASPGQLAADRIYFYQHAGCRCCPAPCQFYYQVEEIKSQANPDQSLQPFLESLFLDEAETSWKVWLNWRESWRQVTGQQEQLEVGKIFCAAVQSAYTWLGEWLVNRNLAINPARRFSPLDRITHEAAAKTLSKLLLTWAQKSRFDDEARAVYADTRQQLWTRTANTPPQEQAGCRDCPVRCRMLPFVAPHLARLDKALVPRLSADQLSPESALEIIKRVAESSIPLVANYKENTAIQRGLLYCLAANVAPTTQLAIRNELLALLRK